MADPSFSLKLAVRICAGVAGGQSLSQVCAGPGMASHQAVHAWLKAHADFRELYAAACERRAETLADEMLQIADAALAAGPAAETNAPSLPARDALQWAKLRIDTRRWRAISLAPHVFGARRAAGADEAPVKSHEDWLDELD